MISVAIATYKRSSFCIKTINDCLKKKVINDIVVQGDNCPEINIIKNKFKEFKNIKIYNSFKNQGPGITKDLAIKKCKNNYILVIDDDIKFKNIPPLYKIKSILKNYAIVQGLILDQNGNKRSFEQPYNFFSKFNKKGVMNISYFVGAIHLIDRKKYLKVGGYHKIENYGFEELQLSIEMIRNGEKIALWNKLSIYHYRSDLGRKPSKIVYEKMLIKRVDLALTYFPFPFYFIQIIIWNLIYGTRSKFYFGKKVNTKKKIKIYEFFKYPRLLNRSLW